jgi:hypothetical protein
LVYIGHFIVINSLFTAWINLWKKFLCFWNIKTKYFGLNFPPKKQRFSLLSKFNAIIITEAQELASKIDKRQSLYNNFQTRQQKIRFPLSAGG